ncbi:nnp-1 protein putative nuclear protein 1 nop52 [Anaeramoeba flamelloides]|uniref:Nnp-1 protein putative nuclear protein 1 nop52 n=1 Tax=Anaeramoeba flamelloides TaxID=1746091 RepID=A0ABQ8YC32_9EUKA|nr:nnp-1 protein putative nuclear protein 1 nop52 [Anaeramoeba flamelloides]
MFKNNKISAKVDIVIGTLSSIKQKNRTVFIKWTRGKHSDKTQNSLLDKYGCTTFNQEFSIPCTLFVEKKTKKIKRKKISFSIILEKENNKKLSSKLKGGSRKEIKIGKIEIDVTKRFEFGSTKNKPLVLEYPLNLKNRTSHLRVPTLTIASRIDLNGNKKRNKKKKKKNQSKEQKEKEILPLLKSTYVLRKFEEFEMLNRKTLKPVSETEDYTEITAKTEFRTDSEEEEKRIKRRQRKDFLNQNNNDQDFKESSQDFSSYSSTEEKSENEEKEKDLSNLSSYSNEEKQDSPITNEKPNNQNENLTFKKTLKKNDQDQENERKKEENDNGNDNDNDRHLNMKNEKPYKNSVSGWNKTRVRKKNSMFELDEEEKELIESFSKKRKEKLKKQEEVQKKEKEEEQEKEEKKKEKKSSSLRISHDHSVDQKDNKKKKSKKSNQEKNTNNGNNKNDDSSDFSGNDTFSNSSGSGTETDSSFSSENESNHGLGLGMFLDNTPDKKKKQEEEEEEEEEKKEVDQLNEQDKNEEEKKEKEQKEKEKKEKEQKEKEKREKEKKEKEKKEKEKREKEKREKEKREKEKREKEKEQKEKEQKEKEKREKEKREKEKRKKEKEQKEQKEKEQKEKEEEKAKKSKSLNNKKNKLKYPKTQQKKPQKQKNKNLYNKRSKSGELISPRQSPSNSKKKKNLRIHKNKKFTPKKQNSNKKHTSHKKQIPSNFESKKKKNNTNKSNRSKTPTEPLDKEIISNTNSKDLIINEQKNVLKNRDEEIENLKKSLQYSKLIKLENWLIERILFFSESIYSNGYPLPSCILMKCFLNWDAFQPNPLILNSNFQLSQIQTENFLSVYLNSINLLIQVNRNKIENLYWLLSNLVFMVKLINEIFPKELSKSAGLKRELKSFKKRAKKNNGLTEGYHKKIVISKEQKELKILKFKKKINLEITNIFQLIFTNVFKSLKPYLIKTFLIYQKSSFSRKSTRKNKKKDKEKKDPSLQIKKIFENLIQSINNNYLPKEFIQIFFKQIVYAIDVTLINELFRQKKYCTCGNGFQIKLKITQFEELLNKFRFNKKLSLKLHRIKQASQCLAMNKVLIENSNENYQACSDIAPDLNLTQIQQLLKNLSIDEFDPQIITESQYQKFDDFIANYKKNSLKNNNNNNNSNFNLEFDITYFFNIEINYDKINISNWDRVPVPIILKSKEEFYFLKKSLDEILKNKK